LQEKGWLREPLLSGFEVRHLGLDAQRLRCVGRLEMLELCWWREVACLVGKYKAEIWVRDATLAKPNITSNLLCHTFCSIVISPFLVVWECVNCFGFNQILLIPDSLSIRPDRAIQQFKLDSKAALESREYTSKCKLHHFCCTLFECSKFSGTLRPYSFKSRVNLFLWAIPLQIDVSFSVPASLRTVFVWHQKQRSCSLFKPAPNLHLK
jgi:hypothetical protein